MKVRIGINGFGRIGRSIFRAAHQDPAFKDIEVCAINDLTDNATLAHLLQYDSVMGKYPKTVESNEEGILVDGHFVEVSSHRDPSDIPWASMGVQYVAECTGLFRDNDSAKKHIDAGAEKRLLDYPHSDLRRARAAGLSMIPTKTGAAAAVSLVIPELKGKFDGLAVRVPTPNVSLVDAVMEVESKTSVDEVNAALKKAANRYLGFSDQPLVSIDYQGDSHSSVVDGLSTKVIGNSVKVMSWYDNEWGYSNRMLDLILHMHANRPL
ncbi:unnamed protein product [Cyprideis torosa]|uniref:Uncharacterized protein n=1 Tax=Cyprideis torosa TaxID=163714 RepID=A0A7R8WST6_9CRUS|nr:unnamed protein product [Cyprideis torosa]CAG0905478.1 unnamed protein product [Cyprideis torosa]